MTAEPAHRAYRVSRWLAVHLLAFGLRHGLTQDEGLHALESAYRHRRADAGWRAAILDSANDLNARRLRRQVGCR
jgi:hypothetical protein